MWIEIDLLSLLPCGYRVAPFAGVWIEIRTVWFRDNYVYVAPFAGVWIEIVLAAIYNNTTSRTLRGCVD